MNEPRDIPPTHGAAVAAAERLRIDAATVEVLSSFAASGVECVVLKGPTLTSWLYRQEAPRSYLDSDLLVRPGHEGAAESVLEALGFERQWDTSGLPDWWREHGSDWTRQIDGVRVDLHRSLPGLSAEPDAVWSAIAATPDTVAVAGHHVPALPIPARALHVSLHAVQHGAEWGKGRGDLDRALVVADDETWRQAADLATRLGGLDAFVTGLRLTAAGAQLAERLGLPEPASVDVTLRASSPPPAALGFEQMAQARGLRVRLGMAWHKLFPPREFLIHWDPRAREARGRLVLARVKRPFWVLGAAPRGFGAWWRARRAVSKR